MIRELDTRDPSTVKMILSRHVDDFVIAGFDFDMVSLMNHINKFFKTNMMGPLVQYSRRFFVKG